MRRSFAMLRVVNDGRACGAKLFADAGRHVPLEFLAVETPPAHGVVRLDGSEYAYVPEPGFVGSDSFRLAASPARSIRFEVSVFAARPEDATRNPPAPRSGPPALPDTPIPWIGLQAQPISAEAAAGLGLGGPAGLLVTSVESGGPAARATLRPSDVVLAFNGTVLSGPDSLARAVQAASIGEAAPVEIWRDRQILKLLVEPAPAPGRASHPGPAD
jgi:membrane-associated protease RseP (regulator of RpoE activity)